MTNTDQLLQLTCPECGHEDQAFESHLKGCRLICSECGAYMERDDGNDDEPQED
jgi:transcription elongation factor Elf1